MRQALHIFRKDVRFTWPAILVALAMTVLFAWSRCVSPSTFAKGNADADSLPRTISVFLILSWWYCIACIVYKEQPAGDRQFWVTRPYSWKSLLAAKALSMAAFVNLPFLISDMAILSAKGFSPARAAANLLGRQIAITAVFVLPAAALAATTRYLAQIAFTAFAALVIVEFIVGGSGGFFGSWGGMAWIPGWTTAAILAGGMSGTLAGQYARRRTPISRTILAGTVGICFAMLLVKPFGPAIAVQSYFPASSENLSGVRLSLEPDARREGQRQLWPREAASSAHVPDSWLPPIRLDGLPPGAQAKLDLVKVRIQGRSGAAWRSDWVRSSAPLRDFDSIAWLQAWQGGESSDLYVTVGGRLLERFRAQPVAVSVSVAMTVYRTGMGVCSVRPAYGPGSPFLLCRSPESRSVQAGVNGWDAMEASYSPIPAVFAETPAPPFTVGLGYLRTPGVSEVSPIDVTTERSIAHLRRDLAIPWIPPGQDPSQQ